MESLEGQDENKKKKLLNQQYERFNKYGIVKNLTYCLSNRLPDIKRKLLEVSWLLMGFYFTEIDLELEDFYLNVA